MKIDTKRQKTACWLVIFILLLLTSLNLMLTNTGISAVMEKIERSIKYSYLHDFQQYLSQFLIYEETTIDGGPQMTTATAGTKIFWLHIPRTSSAAIRTVLIGKSGNANNDWLYDNTEPFNNINIPLLSVPNANMAHYCQLWAASNIKVIKTFISYAQIKQCQFENIRILTVFRNPTERILSLHKRLTIVNKTDGRCHDMYNVFGINKCLTLDEFLQSPNMKIQALISNFQTFQVSNLSIVDYLSTHMEAQNVQTLMNEELFEISKQNIMNGNGNGNGRKSDIQFIALYENLFSDFETIHHLFFTNIKNNLILRILYQIGLLFGHSRMKVLKYSLEITAQQKQMIRDKNEFDYRLYDFVVNESRQLDNFVLYDTYTDYFKYELQWLYCIVVSLLLCIFLMIWRWKKGQSQENKRQVSKNR